MYTSKGLPQPFIHMLQLIGFVRFTPSHAAQHLSHTYYRGCWHLSSPVLWL